MHLHDVSTVSVPGCHVSPMLAHQLRVQVQGAPSVPSAFPCVRHAAALHHITLPVESVSILPFTVVAVALTRALPVLAGSLIFVVEAWVS
jgi:hypothetical protein